MKRRGKTLATLKSKSSRGPLYMQRESVEEEPLAVPKVVRQYTRKKNLDSAESIKNVSSISTEPIGTTWTVNDVKIKEEIIERLPDIEIMPVDVKFEKQEQSEHQEEVKIINNDIIIKEENVYDMNIINVGNNLTQNEFNNYTKIKDENSSESKYTEIDINLHQNCSNKMDNNIKIEEHNVSDNVRYNVRETVMQDDKIIIKIEPEDHLQCTFEYNTDKSEINIPQPEETVTDGIKVKTEQNTCKSHDETNLSYNEENLTYQDCHESSQAQQRCGDANTQTLQNKIPIIEKNHIKEKLNGNTKIDIDKNNKTISSEKQDPGVDKTKLRRIINMPRLLKTYGKKQPETVAVRKCFLVPVNVPNGNSKIFGSPEKLTNHGKSAKERVYVCDMCGKEFSSRASVSVHMRRVHSAAKGHQCPECASSFLHHYLLLAHARTHSGLPLACDLCPKRFKATQAYGEHLNTHLRERLFSCPVCLRRYPILSHLHNHAQKHTPEDTFPCNRCEVSYRSVIDLNRHTELEHKEKAEYPCYVCSRILSTNEEFLTHLETHNNAIHSCAFCPRKFDDVQKWEAHSNEHIEKIGKDDTALLKPYSCEYCNKTFEYKSILNTHIRMHTGERPYECPECSQRLKTKGAMTEHINAHKKPFPCPECDKRFGRRESLSRHKLLHSGERPHGCSTCPMTFVQRSSLLYHIRRYHKPGLQRVKKSKKRNESNKSNV